VSGISEIGAGLAKGRDSYVYGLQREPKSVQDLVKAQPALDPPTQEPSAIGWDPYMVIQQLGWKDRPSPVTYGTIAGIIRRLPLIRGIIETHKSQCVAFAHPQPDKYQTGYRMAMTDPTAKPSVVDRKYMRKLESIMENCGVRTETEKRDGAEAFVKKFCDDSFRFDQGAFEVVMNRQRRPAAFYATDGATIRLADNYKLNIQADPSTVHTVQVFNGVVINEWPWNRMALCFRNPTTSIHNQGYGVSEVEWAIELMVNMIFSLDGNFRIFTQGNLTQGAFNLKGAVSQARLNDFRRDFAFLLAGVENAWRTPILNSEGDLQYIDLWKSRKEMQFAELMNFLIQVICSVYCMNPSEVNFYFGNQGQQRSMFESSNQQKLTESRDRGLKPRLRFLETCLNEYIFHPITGGEFGISFNGLDALTQKEQADLNKVRLETTWTFNELRAEEDKPPLEFGDMPANQIYLQAMQAAQMQQQQAGDGAPEEGGAAGGSEPQSADDLTEEQLAALYDETDNEDDEEEEGTEKGFKKSEPRVFRFSF